MGLSGILARQYKILILLLALVLAVGYVHKLCWPHKDRDRFEYGYYSYEKWKTGKMRWTWQKASMRVKALSDLFGLKVFEGDHNTRGPEGLEFKLFLDGEMLDKVHFFEGGSRWLYYFVPNIEGKNVEIRMEVDKTFNPLRMKIKEDGRDLGVAVSPVAFLKIMPKDGVGFYGWETMDESLWDGWVPLEGPLEGMNGWLDGKRGEGKGRGQTTAGTAVEHPLYHLSELRGGLREPGSTGQGGRGRDDKKDGWMNGGMDEKKGGGLRTGRLELGEKEKRFRWTGKRASMGIRDQRSPRLNTLEGNLVQRGKEVGGDRKERDLGIVIFLGCKHPDVGEEPVVVRISDERGLLRTIMFKKNEWRKVVLGRDELKDSEVLTFEVSRTWNPKRMGVSQDERDLGVAVAFH